MSLTEEQMTAVLTPGECLTFTVVASQIARGMTPDRRFAAGLLAIVERLVGVIHPTEAERLQRMRESFRRLTTPEELEEMRAWVTRPSEHGEEPLA